MVLQKNCKKILVLLITKGTIKVLWLEVTRINSLEKNFRFKRPRIKSKTAEFKERFKMVNR